MYSLNSYGHMMVDAVRVEPYTEALRRAIFPGAVVLEIGTGTGYFALLACRLGARKVYAIEPSDAIVLAEQAAIASGYGDRIQFFQQLSTDVTLEEQADILVSDLRGVMPLYSRHIPSIADARRRLIKPGAVQIPKRDTIFAALVEAPQIYQDRVGAWDVARHGFDYSSARRIVVNEWEKGKFDPSQLLSDPVVWAKLNYETEDNPNVSNQLSLRSRRAGTAHGFSVWFETELLDGVGFSTAPGCPRGVYGTAFFPFEQPIDLSLDETVNVLLRADLVGNDYTWSWKTTITDRISYSQSTFFSTTFAPKVFRKSASVYQPSANNDGVIVCFLLGLWDGQRTNQDLALALHKEFPAPFPTVQEALRKVSEVAKLYSL
jgi:type I protein arginine methyltransferase